MSKKLSAAETSDRRAAVEFANVSVALEGFHPSAEAVVKAQQFISGELDVQDLAPSAAHKLLKTKFYPVDIEKKVIYNFPKNRELDIARKWPSSIVGMPGSRIMAHKCYESYTLVDEV